MTINRDEAGRILQGFAPPDEFLQFIRALAEAGKFTMVPTTGPDLPPVTFGRTHEFGEFIYFLEKPWKWADEFVAWNKAGRPLDASESGWEKFLAGIE